MLRTPIIYRRLHAHALHVTHTLDATPKPYLKPLDSNQALNLLAHALMRSGEMQEPEAGGNGSDGVDDDDDDDGDEGGPSKTEERIEKALAGKATRAQQRISKRVSGVPVQPE
jgi:hypothetical protein